jgi:predicted permease
VDPGFDPSGRAFVSLNLAMSGYDQPRAQQFYAALRDEVARRGPVTHMALSNRIPLDLYGNRSTSIATGDRFESERTVQMAHADRGYFETLGIPIVRGRAFDASDERSSAPRVAIVSAAAARQLWPDREALGQRVRLAVGEPPAEVIGIAHDVKVQSLGEAPESLLYLPLTTGHAQLLRVIVRTDRNPQAAADQVRAAVRALDPAVAVFEARSMADQLRVMLYPYRLAASVGAILGLLTLTLAGIGLYGVLACGVSERVRELAIRVALGAAPAAIVRTAATETLRAAALGIGIGTVLALAAGQLLRGVLFGISPADPLTLGVTIAALLAVVLLSSAGPIRRALRLAPMSVLRQ